MAMLIFKVLNIRLVSLASMWVFPHWREKIEKESTKNGGKNSLIHGR